MAETNLAFSKVVATPTPTAWSQAYSAGRLFAALSLQVDVIPQEGEEHLNSLGKDFISTLESEFFTLENKDLESIKQAITATTEKVKQGVKVSFVICYLNENVLYLFATLGGKAVLKRGEKIGTVLEASEEQIIKSASGYVQEGDIIILQTKSFLKVISPSTLASSLDSSNPDEIAENLAPHLHEKTEGAASAVILLYKKIHAQETSSVMELTPSETENITEENAGEKSIEETTPLETNLEPQAEIKENILESEETIKEEILEAETETKTQETPSPFLTDQFPKKRKMSMSFSLGFLKKLPKGLTHSRKIILTIAVVLLVVIIISSVLALRSRQTSGNQEAFAEIFNSAKEKYDEGLNLKDLNASLAQESFKEARKTLEENKDTFKEGSNEDKQIEDLLIKVSSEVTGGGSDEGVSATEVDKSGSKLLSYEIDNSGASYFTQNEDFVYFLDGKGANSIDKGNDSKKTLFDKSWKTAGGIGVFGSNIYVLDKDSGISKFVPSEDKFTQNDYLKEDTDLSDTAAMAIDGSIYVLFKDGSISKFTKGIKDDFSVTGIDKEMSSPTRIFTTEDADNIYVLDNGNSRVVVLDKEGKFITSYSASVIKNATDIDVDEAGKKILILSKGKIFKIDIK